MREYMKSKIADAFSRILEKEDIDKITVTRLIEECHVSRQTFYYHFHDIMDVLEWTFKRSTQILVQKSLESEDRMAALRSEERRVGKECRSGGWEENRRTQSNTDARRGSRCKE